MDLLYYPAKKYITSLIHQIPPIPREIAGIPIVAYGFVGLTTVTLAAVTIYETNPDSNANSSSSTESTASPSPISSALSSLTNMGSPSTENTSETTNTVGGKKKHKKTKHHKKRNHSVSHHKTQRK